MPVCSIYPSVSLPLVSVIIPTFNRAWCLRTAVDSVLIQDYQPFELIVVDDGSTDETMDLLAGYGEALTLIRQENRGVSAARNQGAAAAAGAFIAFLDSDDHWLPGKLSAQVDFFLSHPEARICQTEEIWIRNGKRANPKKKHQKPSGQIFTPSLALCLVSPSAVMMQTSLFREMGGFDETLPACEDYDLWLRIGSRYPVYLIDTPLIVKTGGHPDQLSKTPGLDKFRIQSLKNLLAGDALTDDQRRDAIAMLNAKCRIYGEGCARRGRMEEAAYYKRQILGQ